MQHDAALAQAETLFEWGDVWERDASVGDKTEKFTTIAYHLKMAANEIRLLHDKTAKFDMGVLAFKTPEKVRTVKPDVDEKDV